MALEHASGSLSNSPSGQLPANLVHFIRTLRAAGLPLGPGKVLDALAAVRTVDISNRDDFYWTLHAVLVNRREQQPLFDQAFHVFWRNPQFLLRLLNLDLPVPEMGIAQQDNTEPLLRRLAEALGSSSIDSRQQFTERQADFSHSWSALAGLRDKDFEQMSGAELILAKAMLRRLRWHSRALPTRRYRASPRGDRIDRRASLRRAMRQGGDVVVLQRQTRRRRAPPLVLLCDISGSMDRYSRLLLHFAHALSNDRERVHTFVFGTCLRNVTRQLRRRDVDQALARVAATVNDWSGGTRIGAALHGFNKHWSRRVLAQGAVVLFISDGLDRGDGTGLSAEMERLHKSCRRLIWLNPLLRYAGFEPKAGGIRALLPHVDEFRPAHNLTSLIDLAEALDKPSTRVPQRQLLSRCP